MFVWVVSVVAIVALSCWSEAVVGFTADGGGSWGFYHSVSELSVGDDMNVTLSVQDKLSKRPICMNHYTTIGMPICSLGQSKETFVQDSAKILADKQHIENLTVPGLNDWSYLLYASKSGAQLWASFDDKNKIFGGFVPHFEGKSRNKMCILQRYPLTFDDDDDDTYQETLEGKFLAVPDEDEHAIEYLIEECGDHVEIMQSVIVVPDKGTICAGYGFMNPETRESFVALEFDCPNFAFFGENRPLPALVTIQLSAFARELSTYESVEEYYRLREPRSVKRDGEEEMEIAFASQFFGSGSLMGKNNTGYACIVGHVVETELRINELSGESFYWALIETTIGMVDVVIHPTLLETYACEPPQVGGVIEGYFWLSGLLL